MRPRRKRGQSAAWEGWNARESNLEDFLSLSPGVSQSQHSIIEWSSSDEESEQQLAHNSTLPRVQVIHLSKNKTLPTSLSKIDNRNAETEKVDNGKDCSFTATETQAQTSESIRRMKLVSQKLGLRRDVDDVSIPTEEFLASNSMCQSISSSNQYNAKVNAEANLKMDPLKTPKQAKNDRERYSEGDFDITPVKGSQGCKSTLKGQVLKSAPKRSSDDDVDVTESTSPIIGSQRIVKKQRTVFNFKPFERSSSTDFVPRKLYSATGISKLCEETTQNAAVPPVVQVIDPSEDRATSRIKKRNLSNAFFELKSKDLSKLEVDDHKEILESDVQLTVVQTGPLKELHDRCFTERKISTKTDHISIDSQFCGVKGRDQWMSQKNRQNNNPSDNNSRLSALRDSLLQYGEEVYRDDVCIEHTDSQNDIPRNEEPDSQADDGIDSISSPCKETLDNSGTFSLTQVSGDPSISTGSAASPVAINEEPSENIKTGSDWIRALQQRTPERPSSKEETEGAIDSAKKKAKKNGLAGRLHRLMLSWESSVHIWTHQMSLTSPQCQKTHSLQKKVLRKDTKPTLVSPHPPGVSVKKMLMDNSHEGFSSPVVKNLQHILVESPVSSPDAPGLSKGNYLHMPKKNLELRIVKVGGRLPNNAALCEVVHSNPKVFQGPLKMENEEEMKSEKGKYGYNKRYCVFFALHEQKINITLHVNDIAKLYSPWQCLDLPSHSIPVLFTSYFTIHENQPLHENQLLMNEKQEKEEVSNLNTYLKSGNKNHTSSMVKSRMKKKIILTTWTCTCSEDATVLPSMCEAQQHVVHRPLVPQVNSDLTFSSNAGFTVVKDTPEESLPQNEVHPAYTILDAIEKCGGVSEVPVTISIRTHRIISHREATGEVKEWELVGQDAGGVFCTVKIPNRPLVCHLTELLEGEGGTHTLTQVTISQRLTNTQDPGLFSLISSLHKAYQAAVRKDPLLYPLLQDQASRPPQTYCYVFTVSLGLTELLHNGEEVVIPVTLSHWSLHEALQVSCDGQRGSLSLHILYKISSFLYVVNHSLESEESHSSLPTQEGMKHNEKRKKHREEEDSKNDLKRTLLVTKVMIGSKMVLPSWIPENGTVMQSAVLKDAVIWHGNVMVDEYSLIQQQDSKMRVSLLTLLKILQPLSIHTQQHDLTLISGSILRVDDETAYTWPTCGLCKSDNVQEIHHGTVNCLACGQNFVNPSTGYCLEVWLNCGLELQHADVKVKLYQRTIEKLLSTCSGAKEEGYIAESLVGQKIGPIVCVLEEARRPRKTLCQTYILTELPY